MEAPLFYKLMKPALIDESKKYPAIFLIHGMGSNEDDLPPLIQSFQEQTFIFSIRGPLIHSTGYALFTFDELGKPNQASFNHMLKKLDEFLTFAVHQYPIDQNNLFLMGFSQGAILSMSYAMKNSGRIKGVLALSGYIPSFIKDEFKNDSLKGLKIFISHGEADPVLPFSWGVAGKEFLQERGANVSFKSYQAGHWVSQENYEDLLVWFKQFL